MTPGSTGGFGDATLLAGLSYTDSTYGITISVPTASSTLATVQVSSAALAATSTALTTSVNPAAVGTSVTLTAAVTGKSPTGTVGFTVNGSALCTSTLSSGVAKCTSTSLPVGTDSVVANYSGGDPTDLGLNTKNNSRSINNTAKEDSDPSGSTSHIGSAHARVMPCLFADGHVQAIPYSFGQWANIWAWNNMQPVRLP